MHYKKSAPKARLPTAVLHTHEVIHGRMEQLVIISPGPAYWRVARDNKYIDTDNNNIELAR